MGESRGCSYRSIGRVWGALAGNNHTYSLTEPKHIAALIFYAFNGLHKSDIEKI